MTWIIIITWTRRSVPYSVPHHHFASKMRASPCTKAREGWGRQRSATPTPIEARRKVPRGGLRRAKREKEEALFGPGPPFPGR